MSERTSLSLEARHQVLGCHIPMPFNSVRSHCPLPECVVKENLTAACHVETEPFLQLLKWPRTHVLTPSDYREAKGSATFTIARHRPPAGLETKLENLARKALVTSSSPQVQDTPSASARRDRNCHKKSWEEQAGWWGPSALGPTAQTRQRTLGLESAQACASSDELGLVMSDGRCMYRTCPCYSDPTHH